MSLRGRIVWLFIGVAIVPLLILAAFSHVQSVTVVERTAEARVAADAVRAADHIADESEAADEALRLVAERGGRRSYVVSHEPRRTKSGSRVATGWARAWTTGGPPI